MYNKDEDLIGCAVEEAIFAIESIGAPWRLVKVDGEPRIVSRDVVSERYNLVVENGKVVEYTKG